MELVINTRELLAVFSGQHHESEIDASDNQAELILETTRKQEPVGHVTPLNLHTNLYHPQFILHVEE
jgi:hypothetical protein